MIPFASQRANGQDLATHLYNSHDNEVVELAELRGAIAPDLHGAFAEWEAQAHSLTRCQKYLYSMSVNPDPAQGDLSREQYFEYLNRVEQSLGLENQPRAVVFHCKEGRDHCHAVWSRIDAEKEKAVQLGFDHVKLMSVTREFARDHGLKLPAGYERDDQKAKQLSLYEAKQQRATGLSREERIEQVTDAWRRSDCARSFVHALEDQGYLLATGKRPYLLVDYYGEVNALPKLIGDKSVRTKDVRSLLENEFPPDRLPSVEEAKALAAKLREAEERNHDEERLKTELADLKGRQAERRAKVEQESAHLLETQSSAKEELRSAQFLKRAEIRRTYLDEKREIREARRESEPKGLAAVLSRYSGFEKAQQVVRDFQDRQRYAEHLKRKTLMEEQQRAAQAALAREQEMRALDQARSEKALADIERREERSVREKHLASERTQARGGESKMPSIRQQQPDTTRAVPLSDQFKESRPSVDARLSPEFNRASGLTSDQSSDSSSKEPDSTSSRFNRIRQRIGRDRDSSQGRER